MSNSSEGNKENLNAVAYMCTHFRRLCIMSSTAVTGNVVNKPKRGKPEDGGGSLQGSASIQKTYLLPNPQIRVTVRNKKRNSTLVQLVSIHNVVYPYRRFIEYFTYYSS
jgi:hypothetical protein